MIARIELDHRSTTAIVAAVQAGHYARLKAIFPSGPSEKDAETTWQWPGDCLIDMDTDGAALAEMNIPFVVKSFKGTLPLAGVLPSGQHVTVHVQIPHIGLLMMDEVTVEENCCTDRLQQRLDEGWRILCVCPPNAQRRPDYVLGRTKEK